MLFIFCSNSPLEENSVTIPQLELEKLWNYPEILFKATIFPAFLSALNSSETNYCTNFEIGNIHSLLILINSSNNLFNAYSTLILHTIVVGADIGMVDSKNLPGYEYA